MKISEKNRALYQLYLDSNYAVNSSTKDTTYRTYKNSMQYFMEFLHTQEGNRYLLAEDTLKKIISILERFIIHCRNAGNNNCTINGKITAISSFYKWAAKRDLIKHHPFRDKLDRLKVTEMDKRRDSYFLTWKQIFTVSLLMELNKKKFDIESRLMWELFLDSACRISAIQNLTFSQLDLKAGYFTGVREKGNKMVDVIYLDNTERLLREWIEYRKNNDIDIDYIFITKENGEYRQMAQSTIRNRIKKIGELIGYNKLYPHTLRKTAVNLLKNWSDINTAAEFANHADTKTTVEHYIKARTGTENRNKILQIRREKGLI